MENVVRVTCVNQPGCINTPVGGNFNGTAMLTMLTPNPDNTIRYTLDGTEPGADSPIYKGRPVTVAGTTRLAAKAYPKAVRHNKGQRARTLTTKPVFTRLDE